MDNNSLYPNKNPAPTVQDKKVEKVIFGNPRMRQRSSFEKVAENIGSFALRDILIPAALKMLSDIWHGAGDIIFGKDTKKGRPSSSFFSYDSCYKPYGRSEESENRRSMNYEEVILDSRGEAEEVIDHMRDLLARYKVVSVADYYDLCGVTKFDYNANYYGWLDLRYIEPVRYRDGYMIRLPRAVPIN